MPKSAKAPADSKTRASSVSPADEDACWRAVETRDARADGRIIVAVKTTGIYCKPSCPSRQPKRVNVRFFANAAEARDAGFRACKRCRPDMI